MELDNHCDFAEPAELPEWLDMALQITRGRSKPVRDPSPDLDAFIERCVQATKIALELKKMRAERERIGFVALSFSDYVRGIAKTAQVALEPILTWVGLADLPEASDTSAESLARLAHALGMSLREALLYIRIDLAQRERVEPMVLLAARYRSDGASSSELDACALALRQIESTYSVAERNLLRDIEAKVQGIYGAESQKEFSNM